MSFNVTIEYTDIDLNDWNSDSMHLSYFKTAVLTYVDILNEDSITYVSSKDISSRRLLRELFTKRLSLTMALIVNPHNIDADNSTNEVYTFLKSMMQTNNNAIFSDMQSQSVYFQNATGAVISFSSYKIGIMHSAVPTSTPTSQPSCGIGSINGVSNCNPCPSGYYSDSLSAVICVACPIDMYKGAIGSGYCIPCPTFKANLVEGSNDCPYIYLNTSTFTYYMFGSFFAVIVVSSLMFAGVNVYIMFMVTLFPILDVFSDLIYILGTKFWSFELFISSITFFLLPLLIHIYDLIKIGAKPALKEFIITEILECNLIWLSVDSLGYPLIHGQRSRLSFDFHDGIDKFFQYWLLWLSFIALQLFLFYLH